MATEAAGFFGRFLRAHLDYAGVTDAPATVVLKLHPTDSELRSIGFDLGFFGREIGFYRDLADEVPVRVPRCHLAELDVSSNRYVLVLEDLAGGRFGNQAHGCTREEAGLLAEELARLHAWGASTPKRQRLQKASAFAASFTEGFDVTFASFVDRYQARVPADGLEAAAWVGSRMDEVYAAMDRLPATVVHGDLRLDNVVFDLGVDPRPVLYDFQSSGSCPAGIDLASLLVLWSEPSTARSSRDELLAQYGAALAAQGATTDEADIRRSYDFGVVQWFLRGVQSSMSPLPLEMFESLAIRTTWALADVDCERLLR
jgi:Ser/Thr protein kinase RdoA (MazF antagonist)